ncbi:MAG: hypothetical protein J0I54_20520 [Bosea sp.]|uniref:hypothetical protein n=1 Tax=unclassified Bosea (in: a-proteobacteria) TaxID=2653178 RepID=UPI0009667550|nr:MULTISPECIES: hypothetical protein [unclassified Bosea (in: a-proteobacteria)]MBN9459024.1 hypothetical protein [Bosea sp. (in: a-proteobacteria)]OJV06233.1 MAG: hypothetical protein BGO20_08225 [Bosea sp. 67-29]
MASLARFGHDADPARDFCLEVDSIAAQLAEDRPLTNYLRERISAALDFIVGGDIAAVAAKAKLRQIADGIRAEIGAMSRELGSGSITLTAPNGAIYHLTLEGDDLWVHLEAAPGQSARIDYEANAGNEGWLRPQQRPALRSTMPIRRARAAA